MNCGNEIFFRMFHYWDNETKDLEDEKFNKFQDEFIKFTSLCNEEYNKISYKEKDIYQLRAGIDYF